MRLKRVSRYFVGKPRYVQQFLWQGMPTEVTACADSDWAGDRVSRKSTSGGLLMLGGHLIKSWSSTQPVIALSSGEAELYALVKAASQGTGLLSMLMDYGHELEATVYTDSTAAIGIVHRRGLGKTRHISTQYLWIQEKVGNKELTVEKVGTHDNPADLLTKHLKLDTIIKHVRTMGGELRDKRAETALKLQQLAASSTDSWRRESQ